MEQRNHRGVISPSLSLTLPDCETLPSQQADPASCTAVAFVGKKLLLIYLSLKFDHKYWKLGHHRNYTVHYKSKLRPYNEWNP